MSDWQEIKPKRVSWGKIGDFAEGTLIDVVEREVRDERKGLIKKKVYELKADAGEYHETDDKKNPIEPPVKADKDDSLIIWGGRDSIDGAMKKIKIGQKVKFLFAEEGAPKQKGYSGFKLIKVFSNGVMDTEWLEGKEITAGDL